MKGYIIVKIIQMSIIFIAAVRGSEEDIPMKLGVIVSLLQSNPAGDLQGGEGEEDGEVDLHHHVNKVVRIRHHYLTGTSSVQYCSVNDYKSPDNHEESSGEDLCEKVSSERFSEKEFYEQSLIDIMGSRVHIIL